MVNQVKLVVLIAAVFLTSCKFQSDDLSKPMVTVSILPQKYFVERIADTLVRINVMVPSGSSPETYEPTPIQVKNLSRSVAYFSLGLLDFEKTMLQKLKAQNNNTQFVNHYHDLDLMEGECSDHNHSHAHSHNHGVDPHVWTSPGEVKKIVYSIVATLSELFPEHDSIFKINAQVFTAEIDSLDLYMKTNLMNTTSKKFFIFHPAFTYLARDYGLQQISLEEDGKSPSMKHMMSTLLEARNEGVKTIFIQKEFDSSTAKTVAEDIGGKVLVIDPLEYNWLENMYTIANLLKDALNGN